VRATSVTLTGGFVAEWEVIERLIAIEARGCRFRLEEDDRFRVVPFDELTPDDVAFLQQHRDAARAVLEYCAQERGR
jgi:hypothetical protein